MPRRGDRAEGGLELNTAKNPRATEILIKGEQRQGSGEDAGSHHSWRDVKRPNSRVGAGVGKRELRAALCRGEFEAVNVSIARVSAGDVAAISPGAVGYLLEPGGDRALGVVDHRPHCPLHSFRAVRRDGLLHARPRQLNAGNLRLELQPAQLRQARPADPSVEEVLPPPPVLDELDWGERRGLPVCVLGLLHEPAGLDPAQLLLVHRVIDPTKYPTVDKNWGVHSRVHLVIRAYPWIVLDEYIARP